jgi:galactose-1-phosphate uridylyltransferase
LIKVAAHNLVGWSSYSDLSVGVVALMEDVPQKPLASPQREDVLTSDLLLQTEWAAFNNPENGGALILSYHL